jgi:hypothetical protein
MFLDYFKMRLHINTALLIIYYKKVNKKGMFLRIFVSRSNFLQIV